MSDTSFMIIGILVGVIQVILILSIVHISGKTDEMANELKGMNEKLSKIADKSESKRY